MTLISATAIAGVGLTSSAANADTGHPVFGDRTETTVTDTYGFGGGALLDSNTLTYTNYQNGTITKRDLATGTDTPFESLQGAFDLDTDHDGDLWATSIGFGNTGGASVAEYASDGTVKQTIPTPETNYSYAWGVSVDADNHVWYTHQGYDNNDETQTNSVVELAQDGSVIQTISLANNVYPYGIDSYKGQTYVAEEDFSGNADRNQIAVYDADGTLARAFPINPDSTSNEYVFGLAVGPDGVIYASVETYDGSEDGYRYSLLAFSQDGTLLDSIDSGSTSSYGDVAYNLSVNDTELYYTTYNGQFEQIALHPSHPVFATSTLASGTVASAYSASIVATTDRDVTYSVTKGTLPDGLVFGTNGSITGTPTEAGDFTFTVTADDGLTTSASFSIHVAAAAVVTAPPVAPAPPVASLPATTLKVRVTSPSIIGRHTTVKASGLANGEKYTLRIAGRVVATGTASAEGTVTKSVVVPAAAGAGVRQAAVVGSAQNRKGSTKVTLYKVRDPKLSVSSHSASASSDDKVTVARLIPGEPVTVVYNGKRISPKSAVASSSGRYTLEFNVGTKFGYRTLEAVGKTSDRTTTTRIAVGPYAG